MKLIDLTCPQCGAALQANDELEKAVCNYCGKQFLIEKTPDKQDEAKSNYEIGYEQEMGRIKAIIDVQTAEKQLEELAIIDRI